MNNTDHTCNNITAKEIMKIINSICYVNGEGCKNWAVQRTSNAYN